MQDDEQGVREGVGINFDDDIVVQTGSTRAMPSTSVPGRPSSSGRIVTHIGTSPTAVSTVTVFSADNA